jgi:RNA polymerase sigma factor (sigma-70 family)
MEASAIHIPAGGVTRRHAGLGLLRLRSDEQLLALFRAGDDEAFRVLYDRYRQRLFAYVRQMLSAASRQDAEDVLQDVFVRAYGALRHDAREMNVRAWLYRVAHNRCIDHLRRPVPSAHEVFEVSRKPLHDPVEEAQRRDDLRRLVEDVGRLPDQQRSALLMREIDGMSYAELAGALDVTVPAVKSLLVRARVGLVEAIEARDADCGEIRADPLRSYDRGVKASGRARRHMRSCHGCREYRVALRGVRRSFAALTPGGLGPLALVAKLAGFGGAGSGAAGSGGAAAGSGGALAGGALGGGGVIAGGGLAGSSAAVGGTLATATACKVAAVVCATALAGGAVEVKREIVHHHARPARGAAHAAATPALRALTAPVRHVFAAPLVVHRTTPAATAEPAHHHAKPAPPKPAATPVATPTATPTDGEISAQTGGAVAPDASPTDTATPVATPTVPPVVSPISGTPQDGAPPASADSAPTDPVTGTGAAAAPPADPSTGQPAG